MLDPDLLAHLERHQLDFCVIGATALAVHGWARYTADIDLLTLDPRVLQAAFWEGVRTPEIRTGDPTDPLLGVVRWEGDHPHDLIVGHGHAMRVALATATPSTALGCPVATALGLVLLKLEAGGPQDRADIVQLAAVQQALGTLDWLGAIEEHLPALTDWARNAWDRIAPELPKS